MSRKIEALPMQVGMLLHSLDGKTPGAYQQHAMVDVSAVDPLPWVAAWAGLVARHEALRTGINPQLLQQIEERADLPLAILDGRGLSVEDMERQFSRQAILDLGQPPLHRLTLCLKGPATATLLWTSHHALLDGRSRHILWNELQALLAGETLPPAPSWHDYCLWRNGLGHLLSRPYWESYLKGLPSTRIPWSAAEPMADQELRGERTLPLTAELQQAIQAHGRFSSLFQTAWGRALSQLTGQPEVVFGAVRACRKAGFPDEHALPGLLINTVPVRVRTDQSCQETHSNWLAVRPFELTPLAKIQHWLGATGPLFETVVSVEEANSMAGMRIHSPSHYPLMLQVGVGTQASLRLHFDRRRVGSPLLQQVAELVLASLGRLLGLAEPGEVGLTRLWQEILGAEGLTAESDFFLSGGDSLAALRLLGSLARVSAGRVPVSALQQWPTPRAMAEYLKRSPWPTATPTTLFEAAIPGLAVASCSASATLDWLRGPLDSAAIGYLPEWLPARLGVEREEVRQWFGAEPFVSRILQAPQGRLAVVTIPLFGDELYVEPVALRGCVHQAIDLARKQGADCISLTGLLPSALGFPLGERVTTGHGATVAAVLLNLQQILTRLARDFADECVAIVGMGSIGQGLFHMLRRLWPQPRRLVLCDLPGRAGQLRQLAQSTGATEVALFVGQLPASVYACSLILGATNAANVLDVWALAAGTIVIDDSAPRCFSVEAAAQRWHTQADVLCLDGGLLEAPAGLRQLSFVPAEVHAQLNRSDLLRLTHFHPRRMTGCLLSGLLAATRQGPLTQGPVQADHGRVWFDLLPSCGYRAAPAHSGSYTYSDAELDDFARSPHEPAVAGADCSIPEGFAQTLARYPDRVALRQGERELTYAQLEQRSRRLARWLADQGVGCGDVVAVCLPRSLELVTACLAILQRGAIYLALDPACPDERLKWIVQDSQARLVVDAGQLAQIGDATRSAESPPCPQPTPSSLASLIYTSGTSGHPKGVEMTHRGIVRMVRQADWVTIGPADVVLQLTSPGFDMFAFEVWGALLNGACLTIYGPLWLDLAEVAELCARDRVSLMFLATSVFNLVIDSCPQLLGSARQVLVGGEAMSAEHARRARGLWPGLRLVNVYGPTESIVVTAFDIPLTFPAELRAVPIGRPVSGVEVVLLDDCLSAVACGDVGEICIAGQGLARGYCGQTELTAEKFIQFQQKRYYRSGDLGRWNEQGLLECLGRWDRQVKIRGQRIELDEIEAVLRSFPLIREAAVMVLDEKLIAFVEPRGQALLPAQVEEYLGYHLLSPMIPSEIRVVATIPVTERGKLDRQALSAP